MSTPNPWYCRTVVGLGLLLGLLGGACADDTQGLTPPPNELPCAEALEQATQQFVDLFEMLDNPTCTVHADCTVADANLVCENFVNHQSPVAVHVSELARAESWLAERERFCGRAAPTCENTVSCVIDVSVVDAGCSDAGRCVLGQGGLCL